MSTIVDIRHLKVKVRQVDPHQRRTVTVAIAVIPAIPETVRVESDVCGHSVKCCCVY